MWWWVCKNLILPPRKYRIHHSVIFWPRPILIFFGVHFKIIQRQLPRVYKNKNKNKHRKSAHVNVPSFPTDHINSEWDPNPHPFIFHKSSNCRQFAWIYIAWYFDWFNFLGRVGFIMVSIWHKLLSKGKKTLWDLSMGLPLLCPSKKEGTCVREIAINNGKKQVFVTLFKSSLCHLCREWLGTLFVMANAYREPVKDVERQETSETHPFDLIERSGLSVDEEIFTKGCGAFLFWVSFSLFLAFFRVVGVGGGCARGRLVNLENVCLPHIN